MGANNGKQCGSEAAVPSETSWARCCQGVPPPLPQREARGPPPDQGPLDLPAACPPLPTAGEAGKGSSSISSDVSSSTDHTPTKAQKNAATSEGYEETARINKRLLAGEVSEKEKDGGTGGARRFQSSCSTMIRWMPLIMPWE
ncbi:uncharacterized protein LOC106722986 isoform X2 [Alligator sinensis]|uniref:Uncharacterized protein LOC106722986 isoform X2 n=1 Tax=Alligator sinensis TaxID=38654 RepID=A0A3Q0FMC4_ALLSI|nr:uncharacterized protein LOC106722986 isoform X2 [Alligator sinensis]